MDDERLGNLRRFLREQIAIGQPRRVARVVGLAGAGKSRLALEAFRSLDSGDREPTVLSSLVLYAVEGKVNAEALKSAVQKLADSEKRAIVVVDRCAPETHRALALMVSSKTSQLSLITLDDEVPSGTLDPSTYKVGKTSAAVTGTIVNQVVPNLQVSDQLRLVRFSDGFPGVANSIACAWIDATPLAHATDDNLVDTYVLGSSMRERELRLKSAALLATFGSIKIDPPEGDVQLTRLASLGRGLSPDDLYAGLISLVERGIARRRGRYVSVQPSPIVMKLAERQWREWRKTTWAKVLTDSSSSASFAGDLRLNVLAAKQLTLLNSLDIAKNVVNHVFRYGGSFQGIDALFVEKHTEVLSLLAEIDTTIIAELLERYLSKVENLSSIVGETRRHLVRTLSKIAFKADTFEDGAYLLMRLAAAENEDWVDNATGQFLSLFPLLLGYTEADGTQRLNLLDSLAETNDETKQRLIIHALTKGLELNHFEREVGPEVHGSRPALQSWQPNTKKEAQVYVEGCATRLIKIATQCDPTGLLARGCLSENFGSLIHSGFIDVAELAVKRLGTEIEYWPEARNALSSYLSHRCTDESGELADRVQAMIDQLNPISLEARVRLLVNDIPWEYVDTTNSNFEEQQQKWVVAVRKLAAEAVRKPKTLRALMPQLIRGRQARTHEFGHGIAEFTDSWDDWLEPIILAIEETLEAERSYGLIVGYVQGFADAQPDAVEAFKRRASKSSVLAPALILVCSNLGLTPPDIYLLVSALQDGFLPPRHLNLETIGFSLRDASPEVVKPLFDAMLDHGPEGLVGALELLGLYIQRDHERLDAFHTQIRTIAENALLWPWRDLPNSDMARHYFEVILTWMLKRGPDDPDASATALALSRAAASVTNYECSRSLQPVLPILLSKFPGVAWPLIGAAIINNETRQDILFEALLREQPLLGRSKRLDCGETCAPILKLPEDTLFAWCHAYPERAPAFVAKTIPLLDSNGDAENGLYVHPVIVRLIKEFGSREDVTDTVLGTMWTKGHLGPEEHLWTTCLKPVTKLLSHEHPNVQRWAKATLRRLRQLIDHARVRDAEVGARVED